MRARLPRWEPGRQGSGYRRMTLRRGGRWDLHVLDYPPGIGIPEHVDPIPGRRHVRLNLELWGRGRLRADRVLLRIGRLVAFRSDMPHSVDPGETRRIVVSLGVAA